MATKLKRRFFYDGKELVDPGELLSIQEVRKFYSREYPELNNANFKQEINDKELTLDVTFTAEIGTKG